MKTSTFVVTILLAASVVGIPVTVNADSDKPCERSEDPVVHEGVNNRACAQNTTDEPNPDYNGAYKSESDEATGGIYFRPNCIHTENTEGSESCDNSSFLD